MKRKVKNKSLIISNLLKERPRTINEIVKLTGIQFSTVNCVINLMFIPSGCVKADGHKLNEDTKRNNTVYSWVEGSNYESPKQNKPILNEYIFIGLPKDLKKRFKELTPQMSKTIRKLIEDYINQKELELKVQVPNEVAKAMNLEVIGQRREGLNHVTNYQYGR